jgi:DNA-binding GntR family transcriptional regulator
LPDLIHLGLADSSRRPGLRDVSGQNYCGGAHHWIPSEGRDVGELTRRVEDEIRGKIESGDYGPGVKLPSERTLAQELGAGRTTIRLVLTKLTAEGLIAPRHGSGYFVTGPAGEAAER